MFGEFLIENKAITNDDLIKGLAIQKEYNMPLGETLVHLGIIEKEKMEMFLSLHLLSVVDSVVDEHIHDSSTDQIFAAES